MAYSKDLLAYGRDVLAQRKQKALQTLQERKRQLYAAVPRLQEIEMQLQQTGYAAIQTAMRGDLPRLEEIKQTNLALQQERREMLSRLGLPEDYLTPPFTCPICQDEGYADGKRCSCFDKIIKSEAYRRLNRQSPLSLCDFSNFDLSYYSADEYDGKPAARKQMHDIFAYCQHYAKTFSLSSPNLLMSGRTGLGKTHLSLSIAKAVIQLGFGVVYGSTPDFLAEAERERFSRNQNEDEFKTTDWMMECDLLILDDLGAEFSTSFSYATLYQWINTRLNKRLPTIISTNLTPKELLDLYGERVFSRLIGNYVPLFFAGQDVRQKKEQAAAKS